MTNWTLAVNGFLGDAEKVEELYHRIRGILSDPNYGTTNSQFWGVGTQETDFHTDPTAATGPAVESGATDTPPSTVPDTSGDTTPDAPSGAGDAADAEQAETAPGTA